VRYPSPNAPFWRAAPLAAGLVAAVAFGSSSVSSQGRTRALYVAVVDGTGAPATGLSPADLIVREDNIAREVLEVRPAEDPMQIAVLVDNSAASDSAIADIRRALPGFVDTLVAKTGGAGASNQVSIVAMAERPTILANYTSNPADLHKAIERVWSVTRSGNYLLDSIYEVLQGFKKREAARPVIVAITTEGPELSSRHYDDVLSAVRNSNTQINILSFGAPGAGIDEQSRSRDIVIEQAPALTGGSRDRIVTSQALGSRLGQLANVLTHEYRVTYAHPDTLIPPDKVTVSARRHDLTAHGTLVKDAAPARQ
jgi:hypothetical protein